MSDALWRAIADRDIEAAEDEDASETYFCEVQQDVTKVYEHVDRNILAAKAIKEGMPLSVIRLSLASYAWLRRLQDNGIFPMYSSPPEE